MQRAPDFGVGISYSPRTVPSGAMQPILLAKFAVYQRSPSAPTVTPRSDAFGVGTGCSAMRPARWMRPRALDEVPTNQLLPAGLAVGGGNRKFRDLAVHGHAADAVAGGLSEPQPAVAHRNGQRLCARRDAVGEFADASVGRDAADAAHLAFGEPDRAVGTENDAIGPRIPRRQREFGDLAARRDAADLVGGLFGEPQIAVGAGGDANRRCGSVCERKFGEGAAVGIEPADLCGAAFAEPEAAIRSLDGDVGLAVGARDFVLADGDERSLLHDHIHRREIIVMSWSGRLDVGLRKIATLEEQWSIKFLC